MKEKGLPDETDYKARWRAFAFGGRHANARLDGGQQPDWPSRNVASQLW